MELLAKEQKTKNDRKTISHVQKRTQNNSTGIPDGMRAQFELLSGFSFDDVRVHYQSGKPVRFGALAYTQGNQVYIGAGQERHLGHELGHIVQQKRGRVRADFMIGGQPVNDDAALELQADSYARQAQSLPPRNTAFCPTDTHEAKDGVIQCVLGSWEGIPYAKEIAHWNAMIEIKNELNERCGLPNNDAVDRLIQNLEEPLYELILQDRDGIENRYPALVLPGHSESVFLFNAAVYIWKDAVEQVKDCIIQGLHAKEIRIDTAGMKWDEIISYLRKLISQTRGLLDIRIQQDVVLTGGHGRGDKWEVRKAGGNGAADLFGAVPHNTHGRNDNALKGSLGELSKVVTLYNQEINNIIDNIVRPL